MAKPKRPEQLPLFTRTPDERKSGLANIRKIVDEQQGRSPRATNMSNFKQVAAEYLPRNGTERFPRPQPLSHVEEDISSNHNDLTRGNGY